jgi:RimJ/RimL family protein N-acetyltransferase
LHDNPKVSLRSIDIDDLELLRQWKNDHRFSFFYHEIIQPAMQTKWFSEFCERPQDYMFVVCYENIKIGCMGFRFVHDLIDIYNVILGLKDYGGRGLMSQAMQRMLQFIRSLYMQDIRVKIVKSNPALKWYKKNGFEIIEITDRYHLAQLGI